MKLIRVLIIGQLPTEVGGNYTTGMGKVVYELSKHKLLNIDSCVYATNLKHSAAERISTPDITYLGYKLLYFRIIMELLFHPFRSYKEMMHYSQKCHMNPIRCLFYKCNFRRIILNFKPDLIHIHSIKQLAPLYFAAKDFSIPIILTFHGVFYKGDVCDIVGRDLYLNNLPFINYATGLTAEMRGEIHNILGFDDKKITIIPNGINSAHFYYSFSARMELRRKYLVGDDEIIFLTVGSIYNRKGQLSFLKHLTKLKLPYRYWIIGKGEDVQEITAFCKQYNIENQIQILGYVKNDDLYKYYSASDIYAHASSAEGQALSEIEAVSTGIPIIVNKMVAGTVIGDSGNATNYYIMDFENPDYDRLLSWCKKERRNRMSKKIYDWKIIADMYGLLYEKCNLESLKK